MVIAYDRKNNIEDTIMFELATGYVIQKRKNYIPVDENFVSYVEKNAERKAEAVYNNWKIDYQVE